MSPCVCVRARVRGTLTVDVFEDGEWKTLAKSGANDFAPGILLDPFVGGS